MTEIRLELAIYPIAIIEKAIVAYRGIADISMQGLTADTAILKVHTLSTYDDSRVIDEFQNFLIGMMVRTQQQG